MKSKTFTALITAAMIAAAALVSAQNDTARQIQELEAKLADLKRQLAQIMAIQGSPNTVETPGMRIVGVGFSAELRRGSKGDAVKRLQEFLAGLPGIYPKGLITGTFGSLTEAAVKRFQEKFGIPAIGIVGPLTRAKLNDILLGKITPEGVIVSPPEPVVPTPTIPPPAPPPAPATTTPPATPQAAATSTPQTATTTPATPPAPSGPTPTQGQLGLPLLYFFGWGKDYLKVQFNHDPGSFTRSYAIYLREPNQMVDTKLGPYDLPAVGAITSAGNTTFRRIGPTAWEWTKFLDITSQPDGTYQVSVTAVGNGGIESLASPGRLAILHQQAIFDPLNQGTPLRPVTNNIVSFFPLTIRISNPISGLYYRYRVSEGATNIWESGFIRQSESSKIETLFTNAQNHTFRSGATHQIRADSYDNNTGNDSEVKQKQNELTFTYQQL